MKSIRIGNDIRIEWPIVLSGDVSKLQDLDLTVEVRPSRNVVDWHNYIEQPTLYRGKQTVMMNGGMEFRPDMGDGKEHSHPHRPKPVVPYVKLPYHIENNTLIAMWTADRQFAIGDYDIILYAHKNEGGQGVCDQYRFVRLVAHSAQADLPDDSGLEAVIAMQPVTLELSGLSAYEIAVIHGFKGTEEEWIESLKPDDKAAEDYREKFMETGINDTMPKDILTKVEGVYPQENTVDIEFEGMHRGSSDGYQSNSSEDPDNFVQIPAATANAAGVMSAEDKTKFDGIFAGNMALPTPVISGLWEFYKNDGSTKVEASAITPVPDTNNPTLEEGYKAKFTGTYKWTHEEGKKDPTQAASNSSWQDLPSSGQNSNSYNTGVVGANTTVRAAIQAAKTGLMVSGSDVKPASGMDTTQATKQVTFNTRRYFGVTTSNNPDEAAIKALSSELGGKSVTKSGVTASGSQYYVFAFPKKLGALTSIIQDGATPVLSAFQQKELTITNAAGMSVPLYVYVSNNPGAFTNAKLAFS